MCNFLKRMRPSILILLYFIFRLGDSTPSSEPRYIIRINEVFLGNDLEEVHYKFVELKAIHSEEDIGKRLRVNFDEYQIATINADENTFRMIPPLVSSGITSDYFVVGYESGSSVDLESKIDQFNVVASSLPDKFAGANVFALLKCEKEEDKAHFRFSKQELLRSKKLSKEVIKSFKACVQDVVVIGNHQMDHYEFLEDKILNWEGGASTYVLDDTDITDAGFNTGLQMSFGYCGSSNELFQPTKFKKSPVTVGTENDCSDEYSFFLSEADTAISKGFEDVQQQRTLDITKAKEQVHINPLKSSISPQCIEKWTRLAKDIVDIEKLKGAAYVDWVDCLPDPEKAEIICRACNHAVKNPPPGICPPKRLHEIATDNGHIRNDKKKTNEMLKKHLESEFHTKVINHYKTSEPGTDVSATSNMMTIIYMEAKKDFSFKSHEDLVMTIKLVSGILGKHHFSVNSARRIVRYIDNYMHISFLKKLVKENKPYSLITDLSTSKISGVHILVILFQYMDGPRPALYLVDVIKSKETGKGMFEATTEAIKETDKCVPGFEDYVKNKCALFVSDGGSSVCGENNSFFSKFRDYVKIHLRKNHCFSHRTQLAFSHATSSFWYMSELDFIINDIGGFFSPRSFARLEMLREKANEEGTEQPLKLKKIFKVRWMLSNERAFSAVWREYRSVYDVIAMIATRDPAVQSHISKQVEDHAFCLSSRLSERNFVSLFHFQQDIHQILGSFSGRLQEQTSILMDKQIMVERVKTQLLQLKTKFGRFSHVFLSSVEYDGKDKSLFRPHSILTQYEQYGGEVSWRGITLQKQLLRPETTNENHFQPLPTLSSVRSEIIDKYIEQLEKYFPPGELIHQNKFNPINLPLTAEAGYATEALQHFSITYEWDVDSMIEAWGILLDSMIETNFTSKRRLEPADVFWANALATEDLEWTDETIELINSLLVHAVGSHSAERTFSFLTKIDNQLRPNMKLDSIKPLLRIKQNGVSITEFRNHLADKIATQWIKDGHLRSDDPRQISGPRNKKASLNRMLPPTYFFE